MQRIYQAIVRQHVSENSQMVFLSGPRQVGKTTISRDFAPPGSRFLYLNWDDVEHRKIIMAGASTIAEQLKLAEMHTEKPMLVLDELHKYPDWKNFLKGLYDRYAQQTHIIVTGSARLDIYKKGGDSLMGRYFPYRVHPLSVREILDPTLDLDQLVKLPRELNSEKFKQLFEFGGFPDPFLKHDTRYHLRWQRLRHQQLLREDIRDVNVIHDMNRFELLAKLLEEQAACGMAYSSLAKKTRVSVDTVTRWIEILEAFYFCFLIRPWSRNVTRSLLKEPKVFLWDWSIVKDPGARAENFIASHLLKATHFWTDVGLGHFGLYYLRDVDKREVDFIITRDGEPWFLVEVKLSANGAISPNLYYYQDQLSVPHAFQVVIDKAFVPRDCFEYRSPVIVPASTFLSQLV